jgi:signal transduction histidine kinase
VSGGAAGYQFLYDGRHAKTARLVAIAVIVASSCANRPHPGWSGHGLVILVSLTVVAAMQVAAAVFPAVTGPRAAGRATLGALGGGLLVGYDPAIGTALLLIFVGLDIAASLDMAAGLVLIGVAVITTVIGVLAAGQDTSNISLGTVVFIGFLAAAGRKQYMLRAEEAELRLVDAERAREEHARAARLAERANAAREIHDILAHGLGALVLQLDALDALLGAETLDRTRATELVARSRALAVEGLREARQAVGTLRSDPPPLVDGLRELLESSEAHTLEITGTPRALPPELSVAVRRTAQESLSNIAKHAPGATARVQLAFDVHEIVLTVTDSGRPDGRAPSPLADTGGGYGIEGLRERAGLLGGSLTAGSDGDGWQVRLRVPVAGA